LIRATAEDADKINALLNDPLIRPTIGGEGELDASDLLADRRNICLFDERGGALFRWSGPGVYEGHSFFRVRAREAIEIGKHILSLIDCEKVWGATPLHLKHVRWFNRQLGFRSLGEIDTPEGRCELFEMRF
jgi:hypothetical protein